MNVTHQTSELMCLLVHSLRNVITYAEAVKQQPEVTSHAKHDLLNPIITKARWSISAIESRIGETSRHLYQDYVRKSDSVLIDNVVRLISRLKPDQAEVLENLIESISSGMEIKVEKV